MATYNISYTAEQVQAAIGKKPIIQNRHWFVWNISTMQYEDTGVVAEGTDGSATDAAESAEIAEYWAGVAQQTSTASGISYDNTTSGLHATDVQNAIDELNTEKADKTSATQSDAGLMSATDKEKLDGINSGATANSPYTSTPAMDGTASAGSSANFARGDHVHPSDSAKLNTVGKGVNLLDNWDFRNPLNSRGLSSYGDASVFVGTIDRWWISNYATLSPVTGGINITQRGSDVWNSYIFQKPGQKLMPGTYTFSVLFAENTGAVVLTNYFTDTSAVSAAVSYENTGLLSLTFTASEPLNIDLAFVRIHATSARIIAAKLELGEESTLAKQISGTWVINDPSPNYAENILRCAMDGDAGDPYSNFSFPYIVSGSYVGTGTYGSSNPNALSFSFAPKLIWCSRTAEKFAADDNSAIKTLYIPLLSTEYQKYAGFCESAKADTWGRKSIDGKTIQWYSTSATNQLNISGITYYYTAIG